MTPKSTTYIARRPCGCVSRIVTSYDGVPMLPMYQRMLGEAAMTGQAIERIETPAAEFYDRLVWECDVCATVEQMTIEGTR